MISKEANKKRCLILVGVLLILVALAVWAFYIGLVVRHYEIKSDKIRSEGSVRVVVVADLHSVNYGENQQLLIDLIKEQEPDIIALPGDIVDDQLCESGAHAFLRGIKDIAPAYYVSGNHEYWSGECDRIKRMIEGYGVTVLENERQYITINGINLCICGIDDPEIIKYTKDKKITAMESADKLLDGFTDLNDSTVNILLAHRPESFATYQQYGFDLIFCGHAHGGQVRLPLILNGLYAPNQGFFPKYAGGLYEENGHTMIVSRGVALNERLLRVFNPPEIVVVDISA